MSEKRNFFLKWLHKESLFCLHVMNKFFEDDCLYRASALTFTTLLALVPLMTVGLSFLMGLPEVQPLGIKLQNFIFQHFVPASGRAVESYLRQFVTQALHLSLAGSVVLLGTAILMFFTIEQTLNRIWRVARPRRSLKAFLLYTAILILAPVLLGLSLAVSGYVTSIPVIQSLWDSFGFGHTVLSLFPLGCATVGLTLLYAGLPNCRVPLGSALFGGWIAALLLDMAQYGFTLYITYFPSYTLLYGPFAIFPIFLTWIYLMWVIVLLGAELTYQFSQR